MEDARVVVQSTSWQERLQNEKYKNWLKVGHALSMTCTGIRPYVERETKAFHGKLTKSLHGMPLCACTYTRHPYHDTIHCLWAKEVLNYHTKGKPTWNQSNASLWHDPNAGYWEVAKLYMPYGCGKGNSCAETDATGLLNLLFFCNYYKTDSTLVERLKDTRNAWAHAATQELDATETTKAFFSIKDFLQDAELVGDTDAIEALNGIIAFENDDLIGIEDVETEVVKEFKRITTSMKDELSAKIDSAKDQEDIHANEIKEEIKHLQTMFSYCMKFVEERDDVLSNVQSALGDMQDKIDMLLQSRLDSRNEERLKEGSTVKVIKYSLNNLALWAILLPFKLIRSTPRKIILMIILLAVITTLDESLDEIGCSARTKPTGVHDLMEMDFTGPLNRAREGFVGRLWLFKDISHSLERDDFKGVMIIAAPGSGKSALVSNLICSKLSSFSLHSQILAYHLCIHSHKNTQNGAAFVRNLASMIAGRLHEYENLILQDKFIQKVLSYEQCSSDPSACFEEGILTPLSRLRLRFLEPAMYIVIDALDECYSENEQDKGTSIVNILSNNMRMFPNWLKVIVTSRNVTDIRRMFSSFDVLDFFPDDPRNLQDIERFIFSRLHYSFLSRMKSFFVEDFSVQAMVNKSQGNFLYIKLVLEYLQTRDISAATWNSLPTSINSIYKKFFERKFDTKEKFRGPRKIFEILVATLSPLTTEELYDILVTKMKDTDGFDFEYKFLPMLEDLSMYLSSIQENQIVTVFHNSLTEWLTGVSNRGGKFYVDVKKGNQLLADYYFKKIQEKSSNFTPQFVYNLATYIVRGSSIRKQVNDFKNLDQKIIGVSDIGTNSTTLHIAASEENDKTVALLLDVFENVDIEDNRGRTPAFYATRFDRLANLRLLYQKGALLTQMTSTLTRGNPDAEEDDMQYCEHQMAGYSLLHVASQKGHRKIVEFLLKNNVSVATLSGLGNSALHLAAKYNQTETIRILMEHGAIPDGRCLYYAALHDNSAAVRVFLDNGAEDTCMNCSEMSVGYFKGQFQFRNLEDSQNYRQECNTALHIAAIKNLPHIVKMLLKSNKKAVYCVNFYGKNPLFEAVGKSHLEVTKLLLKSGSNSSSICHYYSILDSLPFSCPCGYTPLHMTAINGSAAVTKLLLKYKADHNARDCQGLQPIHVASCHGHADILSTLVNKGVNINSKGPNDMTPIHYACKCQKDGIFDKLFELGANGTAITSDGNTPLHYMIQKHSIDEEFILMDPYVTNPIDPIDTKYRNTIEKPFEHKYPWMISMIRFLASFTKGKSYELESMNRLDLMRVFSYDIANASKSVVGSFEVSSWKFVVITSPFFFAYDIGTSSDGQKLKNKIESMPTIKKEHFIAIAAKMTKCASLKLLIENNLIYYFDTMLSLGYDVNCNDSESSSPLLAYLRQGGRNIAKVLVKHGVTVDIQCGEPFEYSTFHLAAYHKLHYLQYISVFRDPVKWKKYLKKGNALFDYLFDKYDRRTVDRKTRVVRVRDGPVTKAIKSHHLGYKVIDECFDVEGYTALHRAAQGGNVVAVKHFLGWGANLTIETKDGFDALTLAIWYAIKYRPYFNFHKRSLSTSLEIEFASFTSSAILRHLTRDKPFYVGCDATKKKPTLLHLAATRGMWRFIHDLFATRDHHRVTGLTANCPTKDNITPMYLAKLHGGDECDWDNPWCKVVEVLLKYGASMIYPDPLTEYFLVFNFLFHELPKELDLYLDKQERATLLTKGSEDVNDCKDVLNFLLPYEYDDSQYDFESKQLKSKLSFEDVESQNCEIWGVLISYKAQIKFSSTKSMHQLFLTEVLKKIKSSLSHLKDVDDATLRCITLKSHQKPKEITDKTLPAKENGKEQDEVNESEVFSDEDEKIEFPPELFSTKDFDMCSLKATLTFMLTEEYLEKNHEVFNKHHRSLNQALKQSILQIKLYESRVMKIHYHDGASTSQKIASLYEKTRYCRLGEATYKYTYLKFLLHTIKFWNAQVQKMSFYPSISKFVSERIQDILLSEHKKKKMAHMILRLSSEECARDYKYLEMLRFTKPPMFNRTIKYD